ncbi:MAG: polysaccharide deacetylase family protein [Coraliomargarita sp.]
MKALVSIHDLMPETMDRVEAILEWLSTLKIPPVTLLIVPGKDWSPEQIRRLKELEAKGHELAAHGWHHHTKPRKPYHRLHAALISRDVAEHLDLDSSGVLELLKRSGQWFVENGFPHPEFYVPPAWAIGPISKQHLAQAPYRMIETTSGLRYPKSGALEKLPLTGFEADTLLREQFLRYWNDSQYRKATRSGKPLRISIHPDDLKLRVADQMEQLLRKDWDFLNYRDLRSSRSSMDR